MRIRLFVFAAFSAAFSNPIQDKRPYLMLDEPTPLRRLHRFPFSPLEHHVFPSPWLTQPV